MLNSAKGLIYFWLLLIPALVSSQKNTERKFGDIKPEDFKATAYAPDSSAAGVVLFDVGRANMEGDRDNFVVRYKLHTRARILNKNAFDLANFSVPLYGQNGSIDVLEDLKATTYVLENNKVVPYKLDKGSIYEEKTTKNVTLKKFALPQIKEGCIIDVEYEVKSIFGGNLNGWEFQRGYPVLWSKYELSVPVVFDFIVLASGYHPFTINKHEERNENYSFAGNVFSSKVFDYTWAMENVPAIKEEAYTYTLDNHLSRIEFQLRKIAIPNRPVQNVLTNWNLACENLYKDTKFGLELNGGSWMEDILKKELSGATSQTEKAQRIFTYIRNNYSCTGENSIWMSNSMKKCSQIKTGNVADINLLLTAFLKTAGLEASPVIISTRDNGKAVDLYPMIDKYNYVVAAVFVDGNRVLLDASNNKVGFGTLPLTCYNGAARIINAGNSEYLDLSADSVLENSNTTVFIVNDENDGIKGSYSCNFGKYESQLLREKIAKTSIDEFLKETKKEVPSSITFVAATIDSLKNYDEPVGFKYDFKCKLKEDLVYFNPSINTDFKENLFKSASRNYPVEMPYTYNKNYVFTMQIPKGYVIDEVPQSSRILFNEDEGKFEYLVSHDANMIQISSTVKLNKTQFLPEDYPSLRDFYSYVIKKQNEKIVFKKIK